MAHKDWCGKPCADCANPCALDESIPCSPDCTYLFSDGARDITNCFNSGCDAIICHFCDSCDKDYDVNNDGGCHKLIWDCSKCNTTFCEKVFVEDLGYRNWHEMISPENITRIICPICYRKKYRISKHFKANSVYQCKAGQQYTVYCKPHIRGYHMVRLLSNGDTICNSGFVFHRWLKELEYIGPREPVNYEQEA